MMTDKDNRISEVTRQARHRRRHCRPRRGLRCVGSTPLRRSQRHADDDRTPAAPAGRGHARADEALRGDRRQIRDIHLSFTPLVEPLSLDEDFLGIRGCEGLFGPVQVMGQAIKQRIRTETGLVASVGVAPNKFLAKLVSDHGKPDGFVVLPLARVREFLAPLPVALLWGVGAKSEQRLQNFGIRTIGQLLDHPEHVLVQQFGDLGRHVWQLAHAQDDRRVVPDREAKSISTETTFAHDIGDRRVLCVWLLDLVDHLASRLRHQHLQARTLDIKIRSADFRTQLRQQALAEPTNQTNALCRAAKMLFERSLTSDLLPVRLLGVGASRLTHDDLVQGSLFDDGDRQRQQSLDTAVDAIRDQFGGAAIRRGSFLNRPDKPAR